MKKTLMLVLILLLCYIPLTLSKAESNDTEEIAKLKEEIRENPNSIDSHKRLGNLYLDLKRHSDAVIEFKEAIRLNPK